MKNVFGIMLFLLIVSGSNTVFAACAAPAGNAGDVVYNATEKVFQYCNDTAWKAMNKPGSGAGGCAAPALDEGKMVYNVDHRVLQGCAGNVHRAFGPTGGEGGWLMTAGGSSHYCGIKLDGTVWCWGSNGQATFGDGTRNGSSVPVPGPSGTWKYITAGSEHACGIKSDDTLWCWGENWNGMIGDNTTGTTRLTPVQVSGGGTWLAVSGGYYHTCGVKTDGTAWCWGRNSSGQIGVGVSGGNYLIPTAVTGGHTFKAITSGEDHNCAIKSDDTIWCWGHNGSGRLGDASGTQRNAPVTISGGGTWKGVDAGVEHTCALKSDDTAWCWGANYGGELGDNTQTGKNVPTAVGGGHTWKQVAAGGYYSCGIKSDNTVLCWGDSSLLPTAVSGGGTWKSIDSDWYSRCGIKTDDSLGCWGSGSIAINNKTTYRAYPTAIANGGAWTEIGAGWVNTCGIKTDGSAWCWGAATGGANGDNALVRRGSPVTLSGGGTWKKISGGANFGCAIKSDDTLWCWGSNSFGKTGLNTAAGNTLVPTGINGGGTWKKISTGGNHACGIKSDDTAWCWGNNGSGQIGDNTSGTNRLVPTAVNGGGTWKQIVASGNHSCGIKSDDTGWCWGNNTYGQIGDNTSGTNRLVPTALNGGGTWKQITATSNNGLHTCGIKSDDTAWCWGYGGYGAIGDNTTGTNRLVPTAVSGGATWLSLTTGVQHSCGLKTDDTVWCWGRNTSGILGDGTATNRLVPTSVAGGGTWKYLKAGYEHTCAIGSDDSMWCWGRNGSSQITDTQYSAPIFDSPQASWCSVPIAPPGTLVYNSDFNVLQYCDGAGWVAAGGGSVP